MTRAIQVGGVAIIIAVFGIFAFILYQILPLFRSAQVSPGAKVSKATERAPLVLGIDEWAELPFVYNGGATVTFTDLAGERATFELPTGLPADAEVTAARLNPRTGTVTVGTADGRVGGFTVSFAPEFGGERRTIVPTVAPQDLFQLPLLELDDSLPTSAAGAWRRWFEFAGVRAAPPAPRLLFTFVDQSVQAAVRGQGVVLGRTPFLADLTASGDLVTPFPKLRMPTGYRFWLVEREATRDAPHVAAFRTWIRDEFERGPVRQTCRAWFDCPATKWRRALRTC